MRPRRATGCDPSAVVLITCAFLTRTADPGPGAGCRAVEHGIAVTWRVIRLVVSPPQGKSRLRRTEDGWSKPNREVAPTCGGGPREKTRSDSVGLRHRRLHLDECQSRQELRALIESDLRPQQEWIAWARTGCVDRSGRAWPNTSDRLEFRHVPTTPERALSKPQAPLQAERRGEHKSDPIARSRLERGGRVRALGVRWYRESNARVRRPGA